MTGALLIDAHHAEPKLDRSGGACARPPWGNVHPSPRSGEAPTGAGADRRTRWLALRQSLSLQRKGTAGPLRGPARLSALHRGVFLRPRDRLLETDRGPLYGKPLIPWAFTHVHPPPPARYRTDPHSWAGQCLPRPPEIRLRRPDPQAPRPFHHLDASR